MTRARRRDPRRLESLALDPENRRTHTERNVEMIASALREVGAARSIVIDEHNRILAGNGVATAAKAIGLSKLRIVDAGGDEIVAVRRTSLTAEQKRALALYDNRAAELAEWNLEQLALDKAAGLDFAPFWTDDEAAALFAKTLKAGRTDPDDVPALRATSIARGEVFALGKHRLLCGDATDAAAVDRATGTARPALVLTDPPYGIGYDYIGFDDSDPEANGRLVAAVFEAARVEPRVWTPGKMNLARELARNREAKVLCWHKKFAAAGNGLGGASTWEPVLVAGVTTAHLDKRLPGLLDRPRARVARAALMPQAGGALGPLARGLQRRQARSRSIRFSARARPSSRPSNSTARRSASSSCRSTARPRSIGGKASPAAAPGKLGELPRPRSSRGRATAPRPHQRP